MAKNRKAFYFGFGAALCFILAGLLYYGVFMGTADVNTAATEIEPALDRPFDLSRQASARFIDTKGRDVGQAILEESSNGVLINFTLRNLPPGEHAIHFHERGTCTPVDAGNMEETREFFGDAGAHLNPGNREHGFMDQKGPHAGDLPNIYVSNDGEAKFQAFTDRVTLAPEDDTIRAARLLDANGTAIIIHEGADDYTSQPTGRSGARIACAPIIAESNPLAD